MLRPRRRTATLGRKRYSEPQASDQDEDEANVEGSDQESDNDVEEDGGEYVEDSESNQEEDLAPVRRKKKARTSTRKAKGKGKASGRGRGKGRGGRVRATVNLPLDVIYIIAEHLDPGSLLFLGRTSKTMRSLFASKSSQTLWNTVKRRSHFPELERTDLNDLAVMSLIYDRDCHLCGKRRAFEC
ncbi:F-box protein [Sporobolomyces salmoneus]|uniref:F-box protein n=1 Tax=Sporobolomyces salmoneus TaxID=183962 RepID=UPI003180FE7B